MPHGDWIMLEGDVNGGTQGWMVVATVQGGYERKGASLNNSHKTGVIRRSALITDIKKLATCPSYNRFP